MTNENKSTSGRESAVSKPERRYAHRSSAIAIVYATCSTLAVTVITAAYMQIGNFSTVAFELGILFVEFFIYFVLGIVLFWTIDKAYRRNNWPPGWREWALTFIAGTTGFLVAVGVSGGLLWALFWILEKFLYWAACNTIAFCSSA